MTPKRLFYAAIILGFLDIVTTVIALGIWPHIFSEANPWVAYVIERHGLMLTMLVGLGVKITIPLLVYFSVFPTKIRKLMLISFAGPVVFVVSSNLYNLGRFLGSL